ncbi:phosphoribosylglycinamide formyltransferase [Mesorhizobium sp. YM1C-6-2]|jgi:formyltetrahydrofolate-dependent phosphoribosylglycinamide formyltransferase|uniref:phosphoribosylglycinamide formyltransferase n=1 Tax=Mesorhizobium sp. YM1C-6-2 TaxID=1827501 RepID=UPI000EF23FCF|nr:phosphoribosylglycinamide formyltransferase [Mesorhizobium sp. YM1C-6-2]RLP22187.1 phosphoribosylglycinamide formyltransferase [Mesorhizobium sp. YM1C-6-2]
MTGTRKRVAILISGRGTNMAKLIEAAEDSSYPAEIVGVISDVPDAPGLVFAADRGIGTAAIPRGDYPSKDAHEDAIDAALQVLGADIVCLAGYMRLLTARFVESWAGRLINIHPSLLPNFKGLDTHRRALEAGLRIHGCTVHFVTAETDGGPIIAQAAVPVLTGDSEAELAARVLKAEHELYPLALRLVADGKASMVNGATRFSELTEMRAQTLLAPNPVADVLDLEELARITP